MHLIKKMKSRRVKQVFSRGRVPLGGGGHEERVNGDDYSGCVLYPYMKPEMTLV
jgi:hypothetical protein